MGTTEIINTRKELVKWINQLEDSSLLQLLNSVKLSSEDKSEDWWETLSENDKENIQLGLRDFKEGKTMSSLKFWKDLNNG